MKQLHLFIGVHLASHQSLMCILTQRVPASPRAPYFAKPDGFFANSTATNSSFHSPPPSRRGNRYTGCQRPANHDPKQTLETTNTSYLVKGALGEPTDMNGIIMGCETVDTTGDQLLLVVPGESVFSSKLKESLISVAVLMEAGFDVVFRIPTDAILDGVIQFFILTTEVTLLLQMDGKS